MSVLKAFLAILALCAFVSFIGAFIMTFGCNPDYRFPKETPTTEVCCVKWTTLTGKTGQTREIFTRHDGQSLADHLNGRYPSIKHWVECR